MPICICVGNVCESFCCLTRGSDVQVDVLLGGVNILGHVGCLAVGSCVGLHLSESLLPVRNLKSLVVFTLGVDVEW